MTELSGSCPAPPRAEQIPHGRPPLGRSRKTSSTQLGAWLAAVGEVPLESALQDLGLGIERLQGLKELGRTDLEALGMPDSLWRALTGPEVEATRDADGSWSHG